MPKYEYKQYKTVMNKFNFADSWFWCKYSINPYSGCEHACIYCDGRSSRYYLHDDFDGTIYAKKNIDILLDRKLSRSRSLMRDVVGTGGTCDAYAPIEMKFENTRKILKVLDKYRFPVFISTKSKYIERDLELLNKIGKKSWATIAFTVTSTDEKISDFLEPGASHSSERLKVMKLIHEKYPNIQCGTNFMPIVPFLEDSEENICSIIKKSKDNGAKFILFGPGLTLRDQQKTFFIEECKKKYPEETTKIVNLVSDPKRFQKYLQKTTDIVLEYCKRYEIPIRTRRWIPNDYRKANYLAAEQLFNESYYLQIKGKPFWHLFKAGKSIQNLRASISQLHKQDQLIKLEFITPRVLKKIEPFLNIEEKGTLDSFF